MSGPEYGLRPGSVAWTVAGPITFGPDGILFVADNGSAKIYAVESTTPTPGSTTEPSTSRTLTSRSPRSWAARAPMCASPTSPCTRSRTTSTYRYSAVAATSAVPVLIRMDPATARSPTSRCPTSPLAEVTLADAPRPTTSAWSSLPPTTRAKRSLSASGRSGSCAARSAPRRSPTWPTSTAPSRRRPVERGVLLEDPADPVPVRCGGDRPAPTSRSSTSRTASGRPSPRSASSCPTRTGRASSRATPARRSSTSGLADLEPRHQARRTHGRRARRDEPAARHGRLHARTARSTCSWRTPPTA